MDKVTSYDEFCESLNGRGDVILFRGQPVSDFVLIPSGLRESHIKTADEQMFRFVDEVRKIFGYDELTCIEIAQHFSLPTRMLDFSYSYTVGLFFACFDVKGRYGDQDGKVYVFNKSRYEWLLKKHGKNSAEVIKSNEYLYKWLQHYVDKSSTKMYDDGIDMPIFVEATRQFDRIYSQRGLFLLWGKDELPLEKILKNEGIDEREVFDTIVISKDHKQKILEELAEKHITEDSLFMNVGRIKDLVQTIKYGNKSAQGTQV